MLGTGCPGRGCPALQRAFCRWFASAWRNGDRPILQLKNRRLTVLELAAAAAASLPLPGLGQRDGVEWTPVSK
jgi:hypothetical protein